MIDIGPVCASSRCNYDFHYKDHEITISPDGKYVLEVHGGTLADFKRNYLSYNGWMSEDEKVIKVVNTSKVVAYSIDIPGFIMCL